MNIGIDIDGTLTAIDKYQIEKGRLYFKKKYNMDIKNPTGFTIKEMFDCTPEQEYKFWVKHLLSYSIKEPAVLNSDKVTHQLKKKGHKIFIITSREFTDKNNFMGFLMRNIVKWWLKKNHIVYDEIIFCGDNKSKAILENHVDLMIDDKPENLLPLKDKVHILCYSATWNRDIQELDSYRVSGFDEVGMYVDELLNNIV